MWHPPFVGFLVENVCVPTLAQVVAGTLGFYANLDETLNFGSSSVCGGVRE